MISLRSTSQNPRSGIRLEAARQSRQRTSTSKPLKAVNRVIPSVKKVLVISEPVDPQPNSGDVRR